MLTLAQQFCKIPRDTGTDFSVLHSQGVLGLRLLGQPELMSNSHNSFTFSMGLSILLFWARF